MSTGKMHADEVDIDVPLVRRLLATQFPQWADLSIEPVASAGTENAIYRLGEEMAVRVPRRYEGKSKQLEKEHRWLPKLAPHLPLAIPVPLALGMPGEGYDGRWSVYRWLEGENATRERIADLAEAATALAQFVTAMQRIDPAGGPPPGNHNFFRGVPLALRDPYTRTAIASSRGLIDTDAVTEAWQADLHAPAWQGPPVWLHGDIQDGNLLAVEGRLSAVIDFGGLGVGDPACELIVAWSLLTAEARDVFRAALEVDGATWARGRGTALSVAIVALPYYLNTNPAIVASARHTIDAVLADHGLGP